MFSSDYTSAGTRKRAAHASRSRYYRDIQPCQFSFPKPTKRMRTRIVFCHTMYTPGIYIYIYYGMYTEHNSFSRKIPTTNRYLQQIKRWIKHPGNPHKQLRSQPFYKVVNLLADQPAKQPRNQANGASEQQRNKPDNPIDPPNRIQINLPSTSCHQIDSPYDRRAYHSLERRARCNAHAPR